MIYENFFYICKKNMCNSFIEKGAQYIPIWLYTYTFLLHEVHL